MNMTSVNYQYTYTNMYTHTLRISPLPGAADHFDSGRLKKKREKKIQSSYSISSFTGVVGRR